MMIKLIKSPKYYSPVMHNFKTLLHGEALGSFILAAPILRSKCERLSA